MVQKTVLLPMDTKKKVMLRCHQLLSGILAKGHLPRVLCQSRLSANDKGDNEITPGAVQRSGVYFTAEENLFWNES